jgi:hypothetical protein
MEVYLFVPLYDLSLSESDVEVRFGAGEYPNLVTRKLFIEPSLQLPVRIICDNCAPEKTGRFAPRTPVCCSRWNRGNRGLKWPDWTGRNRHGLRIDDLGLLLS